MMDPVVCGSPRRRKSRKSWNDNSPVAEVDIAREETLILTHFTKKPTISFGKVKVGKTIYRKLLVTNPHDFDQQVHVEKFPHGEHFEMQAMDFEVPGESTLTLNISWTPESEGGCRQMILFNIDNSYRLQAVLIGNAEVPRRKKVATRGIMATSKTPFSVLHTPNLANLKSYSSSENMYKTVTIKQNTTNTISNRENTEPSSILVNKISPDRRNVKKTNYKKTDTVSFTQLKMKKETSSQEFSSSSSKHLISSQPKAIERDTVKKVLTYNTVKTEEKSVKISRDISEYQHSYVTTKRQKPMTDDEPSFSKQSPRRETYVVKKQKRRSLTNKTKKPSPSSNSLMVASFSPPHLSPCHVYDNSIRNTTVNIEGVSPIHTNFLLTSSPIDSHHHHHQSSHSNKSSSILVNQSPGITFQELTHKASEENNANSAMLSQISVLSEFVPIDQQQQSPKSDNGLSSDSLNSKNFSPNSEIIYDLHQTPMLSSQDTANNSGGSTHVVKEPKIICKTGGLKKKALFPLPNVPAPSVSKIPANHKSIRAKTTPNREKILSSKVKAMNRVSKSVDKSGKDSFISKQVKRKSYLSPKKPAVAQSRLILGKREKTVIPKHPMPFASKNIYYDERWMQKQEWSFTHWFNYILTPLEEYKIRTCVKVDAKSLLFSTRQEAHLAPSKEVLSFEAYAARKRLNRLRKLACKMFQTDDIINVVRRLEVEIDSQRLVMRKDRPVHADIGLKQKILNWILSYNSLWLRIGLEMVFGEILLIDSNTDFLGLSRFIVTRLLGNPDIANQYAHPTVPHLYKEGYQAALSKHTLKKYLILVFFLDYAKRKRLIEHDPCLFCKDAEIKASKDLLFNVAREFLKGEGDITRHLSYIGYKVSYVQTPLHEFDYAVTNLAVDLRDGIRLTRAVEILTGKWELTESLRAPAISRLQKIHNVNKVLNALLGNGMDLSVNKGSISAKDIVDGHREKTLTLLWRIVTGFQVDILLDINQLRDEVQVLKRCLEKKQLVRKLAGVKDLIKRNSVDGLLKPENEKHQLLFEWCQAVSAHYGLQIENFTVSFSDGRILCYLIHHYYPGLLPLSEIRQETTATYINQCEDQQQDSDQSFDELTFSTRFSPKTGKPKIYETLLANEAENFKVINKKVNAIGGVPAMLRHSDMSNTIPDEKVVITYVTYLAIRLLEIRHEARAASVIQMAWRKYIWRQKQKLQKVTSKTEVMTQWQCSSNTMNKMKIHSFPDQLCDKDNSFLRHAGNGNLSLSPVQISQKHNSTDRNYLPKCNLDTIAEISCVDTSIEGNNCQGALNVTYDSPLNLVIHDNKNRDGSVQLPQEDLNTKNNCVGNGTSTKLNKNIECEREDSTNLLNGTFEVNTTTTAKSQNLQGPLNVTIDIDKGVSSNLCEIEKVENEIMAEDVKEQLSSNHRSISIHSSLLKNNKDEINVATVKCVGDSIIDRVSKCETEAQNKSNVSTALNEGENNFYPNKSSSPKVSATNHPDMPSTEANNTHCLSDSQCELPYYIIDGHHGELEDSVDGQHSKLEDSTDGQHGELEDSVDGHHSELEDSTDGQHGELEDYTDGQHSKLEDSLVSNGELEDSVDGQHSKLEDSVDGQHGELDDSTDGHHSKLEDSVDGQHRELDDSTDGHHSKPEDSTDSHHSKPEDSTDGHHSKPEDSTDGHHSKPEDSTDGQHSKPEDSTDGQHSKPEDSTDGQHSKPDDSTDGQHSKLENSTDGQHSKLENSTDCQHSELDDSTDCQHSELEDSTDGLHDELEDSTDGQHCKLDDSTDGQHSELEDSTDGHHDELEDSTDGHCSKLEDSTDGHCSKLKDSTDGHHSELEDSVDGQHSKLEDSTAGDNLPEDFIDGCYNNKQPNISDGDPAASLDSLEGSSAPVSHQTFLPYTDYNASVIQDSNRCNLVNYKQYSSSECSFEGVNSPETSAECKHNETFNGSFVLDYASNDCRGETNHGMVSEEKTTMLQNQLYSEDSLDSTKSVHEDRCAIVIQRWYRNLQETRRIAADYHKVKKAIIVLQSYYRMYSQRKQYHNQLNAVHVLQAAVRMHQEKQKYLSYRRSAIKIQQWYRNITLAKIQRKKFLKEKQACIQIQSAWRGVMQRRLLRRKIAAAVVIQKHFKKYRHQSYYFKLCSSAVLIQRLYRSKKLRRQLLQELHEKRLEEEQRQNNAACLIQATWKGYIAQRNFFKVKAATRILQQYVSAYLVGRRVRRDFIIERSAAIKIQSQIRGFIARRKYRSMIASVVLIQALFRGYQTRTGLQMKHRSAVIIQSYWRSYLAKTKFQVEKKAVTKMQAIIRAKQQQKKYLVYKNAAIAIQKWYRATRQMRQCHKEYLELRKHTMILQDRFRAMKNMKTCHHQFLRKRKATITIQAYFRQFVMRRKFLQQKQSVALIQDWFRACRAAKTDRLYYLSLRSHVVKMQAYVRSKQQQKKFLEIKDSVLKIQNWYRSVILMKRDQQVYVEYRTAVITIQSAYRRHRIQKQLKRKQSVIKLQRWWRSILNMKAERKSYLSKRAACCVIQQWIRSNITRKVVRDDYLRLRAAVVIIQSNLRRVIQERQFHKTKLSAIQIQRWYRACVQMKTERNNYCRLRTSVIFMQSVVRRNQQREQFLTQRSSAMIIQRWYRRVQCCREVKERIARCHVAATLIQKWFKKAIVVKQARQVYTLDCHCCTVDSLTSVKDSADHWLLKTRSRKLKAVCTLQRYCRCWLQRRHEAATVIQSLFRGWIVRKTLTAQTAAAIKIQANIRGFYARKLFEKKKCAILMIERCLVQYLRRRDHAILLIQRVVRGWIVRKNLKKLHHNATLIKSYWKGYKVRCESKNTVTKLRYRLVAATKEATEDKKLMSRFAKGFDQLMKCKQLSEVLYALINLEAASRLSPICCLQLARGNAVPVIYNIIKGCNRSVPHMELIKYSIQIFLNLAKYAPTIESVYSLPDAIDIILNVMMIFREKGLVFSKSCILLGSIALDLKEKGKINILLSKQYMEKIMSLYKLTERKYKQEENRVVTRARLAAKDSHVCYEKAIQSRIGPDWLLGKKKLQEFEEPLKAITYLMYCLGLQDKLPKRLPKNVNV
ncbi:spindle-like microcephaly-associated homolog [Argonauta hians]